MKYIIILLLAALRFSVDAQSAKQFNLDFDTFDPARQLPQGWFKWGTYELGADSIDAYAGSYAGYINSGGEAGAFGCLAYRIPAEYEGSTIQLEGFMKIQDVTDGFAGLLLRIDGGKQSLAFDNMESQHLDGTRDWTKYTVTLPYPEEADVIFLGGILTGKGKAWFDNFVLTIDGKDIQTLAKSDKPVLKADLDKEFDMGSRVAFPENLREELIGNLDLLGRVWGFLKYHHPEIAKGNYNWDYELFRFLPVYLQAADTGERDRILLNWIAQFGEVSICETCKETSVDAVLKPDLSWITDPKLDPGLQKKLDYIYKNRHQGKHYYIRMAPNVGNPDFLNERPYSEMPYPDEGFRLLALYRYWNMIQYFYPNKSLTDKNWNMVLREYIPRFIHAQNELEYERAAIELIGEISDTHANLWGGADKIKEEKGGFFPPVNVQFIEDKLVVTDFYDPKFKQFTGVAIGDVITHINEQPIDSILNRIKKYYPASNNAAKLRDISGDLLRSVNKSIDIRFAGSDGKENRETLRLYPPDSLNLAAWYRGGNEKCYKFLKDGIGYITLKNIREEDIDAIKQTFEKARGIVIDIRNYPSTFVPFLLGSYFVSTPTPFVKFSNGNSNNPGEFTMTESLEIPPASGYFKGKLVVLVNERSQSQAEYTAMAFRAGDNTTIVGSTTAGADGNVSPIFLPGGLRTMISGIGVYYPDGKETQRVGIIPDIEVKPTIKGIRNGKDELLERAIELIEN